jgi:hypothetical protein
MLDEKCILALTTVASFQSLGEQEGAVILMTDSGQLYTCNDTVVAMLKAMDGKRSFGEIVALVNEEFEVDRERLAEDLSAMADELEREGIVRRVEGAA